MCYLCPYVLIFCYIVDYVLAIHIFLLIFHSLLPQSIVLEVTKNRSRSQCAWWDKRMCQIYWSLPLWNSLMVKPHWVLTFPCWYLDDSWFGNGYIFWFDFKVSQRINTWYLCSINCILIVNIFLIVNMNASIVDDINQIEKKNSANYFLFLAFFFFLTI